MFFRKKYEARVGKDKMIMSELLSNAFRSVQHQIKANPLRYCLHSSTKRARCRLNLYAMNIGILNYFLVTKFKKRSVFYVSNFSINLVETICLVDSQVVDNIEELVLDKKLISSLNDSAELHENYSILSKKELLNYYIENRIKEYHYAVGLKIKLMSKSESLIKSPYMTKYPVTKVFIQDFFGTYSEISSDFSNAFTHNISMKSLNLFSDEIDEIFE